MRDLEQIRLPWGTGKKKATVKRATRIKELPLRPCRMAGELLELSRWGGVYEHHCLRSPSVLIALTGVRSGHPSWPTTSASTRALAHTSPSHPTKVAPVQPTQDTSDQYSLQLYSLHQGYIGTKHPRRLQAYAILAPIALSDYPVC